jgi:ADP-ribosylglycohydrolase
MDLRSRIRGAALGIAIGDRMGMPVEMYSPERIAKVFPETGGRVTDFLFPRNHKFFANDYNDTTDDWDYTEATFNGFIEAESFEHNALMRSQAAEHVKIWKERKGRGCGGTTRKALDVLENGGSWAESAPQGENEGFGNGVAMKMFPVAAAKAIVTAPPGLGPDKLPIFHDEYERFVMNYTLMTHAKSIAVSTTFAMYEAYLYCLRLKNPLGFSVADFVANVVCGSARGMRVRPDSIVDNVTARLCELINHNAYNTERIIKDFGGGGCYCYHSVPFSLMFFVKNPLSIDTLFDTVSAGGDTDSNGSMVGGLLGALHGESFWPSNLLDKLSNREVVVKVADRFCDRLGL